MSGASWPQRLPAGDPFADGEARPDPGVLERHEGGAPERPPWVPDLDALGRVATDVAPHAGSEAPDRLWGPLADLLRVEVPAHRLALRMALAEACFLVPEGEARSPHEQWRRRKPLPTVEARAAFRAVARAPLAPWRLHQGAGGLHLEPLLPLAPAVVPRGPVHLGPVAAPMGPPRPGQVLLARVVFPEQSPTAAVAFVLPLTTAPFSRWAAERGRGATTLEALLRTQGHLLVRRASELCWLRGLW